MIYDCFIYNGEKELLDIRLNEFNNCSDAVMHILIEAAYTHTGNKKPLYFDEIKDQYKDWPIMSISVEQFPSSVTTARGREECQRNMIKGALRLLLPSDDAIVAISDVDEIINHHIFNDLLLKDDFAALIMDKYGYYLNMLEDRQSWDRARVCKYSYLHDKTPEEVRNSGYPQTIDHAGWHFSWLRNRAKEKLKSFSHTELDVVENFNAISMGINFWNDSKLVPVEIDDSFPEYIQKNKNKLNHLIK